MCAPTVEKYMGMGLYVRPYTQNISRFSNFSVKPCGRIDFKSDMSIHGIPLEWLTFDDILPNIRCCPELSSIVRPRKPLIESAFIMTSSNWNIFRVTGLLLGESTGHRWIPLRKGQWRGAFFLWAPEQTAEQTVERLVIWDAIALIMASL